MISGRQRGFTLVEVVVVLVIFGVLMGIVVSSLQGLVDKAREGVDNLNIRALNLAAMTVRLRQNSLAGDLFQIEGVLDTDQARLEYLFTEGYISEVPTPQQRGTEFHWLIEKQIWVLRTLE